MTTSNRIKLERRRHIISVIKEMPNIALKLDKKYISKIHNSDDGHMCIISYSDSYYTKANHQIFTYLRHGWRLCGYANKCGIYGHDVLALSHPTKKGLVLQDCRSPEWIFYPHYSKDNIPTYDEEDEY